MSQTATAPAPPQGQGAATQAPGIPAPPVVAAQGSTPALLTRLRLLAAVVVFAVAAGLIASIAATWQATQAARSDSAQLLRAQGIKVNLLRADALATNAFLIGGLESSDQRARYDAAITEISEAIAAAADAQPADRRVLEQLNDQVVDFAEAMEQARANNRQGYPVGSAYLAGADKKLRAEAIPLVNALVQANTERAESSMGAPRTWLPLLLGALGAALLWWINRRLAQTFHRRFNVGVAAAGAAILGLAGAAAVLSSQQSGSNDDLFSGSYRVATAGAEARSAGNDAKANESLRLIRRGSGASNEKAWEAAKARVVDNLSQASLSRAPWNAYDSAHAQLVDLDNGGDWDAARDLAVSPDADAPSALFTAFDEQIGQVTQEAGAATTASLGRLLTWYPILLGLTLLGGFAAAGLAWRGITERLREYA